MRAVEGAHKALNDGPADGVLPPCRLYINHIESKRVLAYDAVDASIAAPP